MIFEKGDIVLVDLNPTQGHEQGNKRPVLVINNVMLAGNINIVLPITSRKSVRPFEIDLDNRTKTQGTVLAFQVRAVDLVDRQATFLEHAPDDIVELCCEAVVDCVE